MTERPISYSFKDDGDVVEVSSKVKVKAEDLDVRSTTTTLIVKEKGGAVILNAPQLFGTVDASKTVFEVRDGELSVTLHKLAPNERWTSLETDEGSPAPQPKPAPEGGSEGAMAAREQVKQLFEAALKGDIKQLERIAPGLSSEGLGSVKDGNGRNALHFAAQGDQQDMAAHLLEKEGIPANSQDDKGETPLGLASGLGQVEMARLLLRHGADVRLTTPPRPQPLHRAAATGNTAMVELLLEAGAQVDAPSDSGTPLLWAAGSGGQEVVSQLLAAGADPNAQTPEGVTAMLMAAAAGDLDIIEDLGRRGADANASALGGVTPLHAAAELGNLDVVKALLKAKADPNAVESEGGTKPIHTAASAGHADIVELLLPVTRPGEGETWTLEALMAETSSAASTPSPSPAKDFKVAEPEDPDPEKAARCKKEGDQAFREDNFGRAEELYTAALRHDTSSHLVWANRSAARLRRQNPAAALEDARTSRKLNPKYLKAWFREGEAAKMLELYEEAAQAFFEAYSLDPSSPAIASEFQDAVRLGREQHQARQAASRGS